MYNTSSNFNTLYTFSGGFNDVIMLIMTRHLKWALPEGMAAKTATKSERHHDLVYLSLTVTFCTL